MCTYIIFPHVASIYIADSKVRMGTPKTALQWTDEEVDKLIYLMRNNYTFMWKTDEANYSKTQHQSMSWRYRIAHHRVDSHNVSRYFVKNIIEFRRSYA